MQHPMPVIEAPVWDSDTDEVVETIAGAGTTDITIPADCYYVIFSTNGDHTDGMYVTVDGSGDLTGIQFAEGGNDLYWGTPTTPGTVFEIHNDAAATSIVFNTIRFYNKAK